MATTKSTTKAKSKTTKKPVAKKTAAKKQVAKKSVSRKASAKTTKKTTTKKIKAVKKSSIKKDPIKSIRSLHLFIGLLMALLSVAAVVYGNDLQAGFSTAYLTENTLTSEQSLLAATKELFVVNLKYLAAGVLMAVALYRVATATVLFKRYSQQIKNKLTSLNWIEYAIFNPLSLVFVASVVGVRDVMSLLLLASVPMFTAVLGYLTDRYNLIGKKTLLKQKIATGALILPWLAIGVTVLHTFLYGFVTLDASMYIFIAASFIFYLALSFAHKMKISKGGSFSSFLYSEKMTTVIQALFIASSFAIIFS